MHRVRLHASLFVIFLKTARRRGRGIKITKGIGFSEILQELGQNLVANWKVNH